MATDTDTCAFCVTIRADVRRPAASCWLNYVNRYIVYSVGGSLDGVSARLRVTAGASRSHQLIDVDVGIDGDEG